MWNKIAVIDTENMSADLYSDLGPYQTIHFEPPHTPERYIEALNLCMSNGIEVVVIDSTSHEWDNLLDYHSSLVGNSFTNWAKVNPRHDAFVSAILHADVHIICTMRSKQEYVLSEKNGKQVPEKVGMKPIQRENLEYEFTIAFELDMSLKAKVLKDRTCLFVGKYEFVPTVDTGKRLKEWCNQGAEAQPIVTYEGMIQLIGACTNGKELAELYDAHPQYQQVLNHEFGNKSQQLKQTTNLNHLQPQQNGSNSPQTQR